MYEKHSTMCVAVMHNSDTCLLLHVAGYVLSWDYIVSYNLCLAP